MHIYIYTRRTYRTQHTNRMIKTYFLVVLCLYYTYHSFFSSFFVFLSNNNIIIKIILRLIRILGRRKKCQKARTRSQLMSRTTLPDTGAKQKIQLAQFLKSPLSYYQCRVSKQYLYIYSFFFDFLCIIKICIRRAK